MSELIHISYGGHDRVIYIKGKKFLFEDHPHCGPIVLDKNGDPLKNQPPESSPFWEAVSYWYQQGKKTKEVESSAPWCIWEKPSMQKMRHVGGNNYVLVTK